MDITLEQLHRDMEGLADKQKAKDLARFFKTGKGEYGEGDVFLGVMVPQQRQLVQKYWRDLPLIDLKLLIKSKYHEERLTALLIAVKKFQKSDSASKKGIFDFYLENTKYINNWDLVDLSAPRIVGVYLEDKDKSLLNKLAMSHNIWERRIAALATFYYIGNGDPNKALEIAEILVDDKHDLIQKAVGWMLREIGKRCSLDAEKNFLDRHLGTIPRVALRYAIEKFNNEERAYYLNYGKTVK